jgi:Uma2 family endonuclease
MTGVNRRHDRIVVNALGSLINQLRGQPCRPFTSETAIRIPAGNIRYPDLGVDCGRPDDLSMAAAKPALVVEVLSPSTSQIDRTIKLNEYKTVPAVTYILLIDPDKPHTHLHTRMSDGTWRDHEEAGEGGVVQLPAIAAALAHADVYDGITFRHRPTLVD